MAAGPTGIWFSGVDQSSSPPSPVVYYWSAGGLRKFPIPGRFEALAAVGQITYGVSEGQLLVNEGEDFTPSVSFRDITVKGIASTSTGLWVATASNEIWYAGVTVRKVGDANGQIIALAAGTAGELWYVLRTSEGQSLWCLELDHNTRKIADIPVRDASVVALSQDNTQTVWVAWSDKKLSRLSAGKWEVLDLSGTASALGTDDEGRLLIGYLKTPDQRAELLRLRDSQTLPIADAKGSVHAIVTDQLGGNWVAAGTSGAYRLEGLQGLNWLRGWEISSASGSQTIPITLQKQRSAAQSVNFAPIPGAKITTIGTNPNQGALANGTIGCITSDNNGAIYFGTGYAHVRGETIAGSGISRWDHRITTNWTSANGFALGTVNACANDPVTNRLWFGTQNGLVQFNPSNDTFSSVFLSGAQVQDIRVRGGDLWVATFNQGIYRLALSGVTTGTFLPGQAATSLAVTSDGTLWAGTSAGLYNFTGSTFAGDTSLGYIEDIEGDASGNLWIATGSGTYRRSGLGVQTRFLAGPSFGPGLYHTFQIGRDPSGNLWFTYDVIGELGSPKTATTYLPALQVNSSNPAFVYLTTANGFPTHALTAVYPISSSEVWFGTNGAGAYRVGGPFDAPGWPQTVSGAVYHSSPLLVDLDGDKMLEVVIADTAGKIIAFRSNGSVLWTYDARSAFPAGVDPGSMTIHSSPAAADVDADGQMDLVVGLCGQGNGQPCQGGVLILNNAGQFKRILYTDDITSNVTRTGGPDGFREGVFAAPVLANVDADPEPEIFVGGFDNVFHGWNSDGTSVAPHLDPYSPNGFPYSTPDTTLSSAVVVDLSGQGEGPKSIIFGHDYSGGPQAEFNRGGVLRGLDAQGRPIPGFPKGNLEQVIWSSPVAVDLDGDGKYEIIHGSGLDQSTVGSAPADALVGQLVYAWRADGSSYLPGMNGRLATTEGASFASFAVGDIDNDGSPELVIFTTPLLNQFGQVLNAAGAVVDPSQAVGQKVYAFRTDGSVMPGFPVRPRPTVPASNLVGSPILADVNGDGFLDIIVPVGGGLIVLDRNGRALPGMGLFENLYDERSAGEITSTPAVADIDNDGRLEVVWALGANGSSAGVVKVAKLGPVTNTAVRSWPMFRRAVNRNGIFGPLLSVAQTNEAGGVLTISAQAFAGRSGSVLVTADTRSIGGSAGLNLLDNGAAPDPVANDGRFFATVNVSGVAPGRYAIPVTASDGSGARVDTNTIHYVKTGSGKLLSVVGSLDFGQVSAAEPVERVLNVMNIGTTPVTISSIAAGGNGYSITSPSSYPQILQPGAILFAHVRFVAGGAPNGTITIASDEATTPSRVLATTAATVGGQAGCTYTLTPSRLDLANPGDTGSFNLVTSAPGCAWSAASNKSWAQIYPLSGTGNAAIQYTVFPNYTSAARFATFTVGTQPFPITEQASVLNADQRFVAQMYSAFFGRVPTLSELNLQVSALASGSSRSTLFLRFFNSEEFNASGRFIAGLYVGLLNRDAEYDGWLFQRNAQATGVVNPLQLVSNFVNSAEYRLTFGSPSNEEFVRLLYRYILLREGSPAEVAFQASNITSPDKRVVIAQNFLNSMEFRISAGPRLTTFLFYALLLQRDPDATERALRVAQISGGRPLADIADEILGSTEFAAILR